MPIKLEDYVAKLPAADVCAVEKRTAELIQEEANLRQLREQVGACSQVEIARKLKINQASVSKLERRTDMYVRTLSNLIRAMGGELEIVARFPGKTPVRITQFRELTGS
jgi:DNA-binding CsgD family transcriptional regulator